jgi:hypothetical protein
MKHVALSPVFILAIAVDELAELKAKIAPMQERADQLVTMLKSLGVERIDGTLHTAVVSLSERETLDTKAIKLDYPELVKPYLKATLVETLKLTARKTH